MARENASVKARRYLVEGRLVLTAVDPSTVAARTRGDGAFYRQDWSRAAGWSCDCEARGRCAHLLAVGLVVAVDLEGAAS